MLQGRNVIRLREIFKAYELDINPMNWNITKEIFVDAWQKAPGTRKERYTILNEISLDSSYLERIYDQLV